MHAFPRTSAMNTPLFLFSVILISFALLKILLATYTLPVNKISDRIFGNLQAYAESQDDQSFIVISKK